MYGSFKRKPHPFPNNQVLNLSKTKTYANAKFNMAKIAEVVCNQVENIKGKFYFPNAAKSQLDLIPPKLPLLVIFKVLG